jgi:hypothetical protein
MKMEQTECSETLAFKVQTPVNLFHTYPPVKMEQTQCSQTLAFKLQMLVNHPEESIQNSEHGESLKSNLYV